MLKQPQRNLIASCLREINFFKLISEVLEYFHYNLHPLNRNNMQEYYNKLKQSKVHQNKLQKLNTKKNNNINI